LNWLEISNFEFWGPPFVLLDSLPVTQYLDLSKTTWVVLIGNRILSIKNIKSYHTEFACFQGRISFYWWRYMMMRVF